ncbi:MAG: PTS sugar transporter subunit IIA, partial [Longicatena sp.]
PLAYDVGVMAASYIHRQQHWYVSDDEIAYLAVHFSLSLSKKENKINPTRILIICNARRGDYLMMQHTFLKEFHEMISELDIINAVEIPQHDLTSYDCIFATFLNHPLIPTNALRINFFIDQKDIQRIKRALSGVGETAELLKYFKEEYFLGKVKATSQSDVLRQLCDLANQCNCFYEDLYTACMRREQLGSTAYGHLIALPHPDSLISQKTVVITAILQDPVLWSGQKAQLIFLICVETGNHKDLRVLFECISKFMMDERSVQEVIDKGDYKTFMNNLSKLIG